MALLLLHVAHNRALPHLSEAIAHSEYQKADKLTIEQKLNQLSEGYKRRDGEQEWSYKTAQPEMEQENAPN